MQDDAKFDLHAHTTASDGTLAPAELVRQAKQLGLSGIAITDHDTTAGFAEAEAEGRRLGIEVVRGLEINTDAGEGEFHFLGYLVDEASKPFQQAIRRAREERWVRARAIVAKLRGAGIRITDDDVLAAAHGAPVCRPHVAVALTAAGYASTHQEAYARYLRGRSPFFVPHTGLSVREAVAAIRAAGGVPVLSHPTELAVGKVLALRPLGLMGVEVNHPDHSPELAARWRDVARRHGLVATGGSDFHGADSVEPDRVLGSILAPGGALEALREAQERLKRGA
ncbi:MAG: PHP domain-containing protein [candidate division NC10 bacterium]|nr:PHP domain-containing protein [candidate division NC10 bacterium]